MAMCLGHQKAHNRLLRFGFTALVRLAMQWDAAKSKRKSAFSLGFEFDRSSRLTQKPPHYSTLKKILCVILEAMARELLHGILMFPSAGAMD
jgi:hypothetical protein